VEAPRRYGLIRVIAFILKLLAWLALLVGVGSAIALLVMPANATGGASSLLGAIRSFGFASSLLLGALWFVQFYAFGAILSLLLDIEENTRALAAVPSSSSTGLATRY